jgi:hypothetical protein
MLGILNTPRMRLRPEATIKRMTVLLKPKSIWQSTPGEQKAEIKSKFNPLMKTYPVDTHQNGYLPGMQGHASWAKLIF